MKNAESIMAAFLNCCLVEKTTSFPKHNCISISKSMLSFFSSTQLQSTHLDPDYGVFIGYQMPSEKHEGLNACLCLLRKNLNFFLFLSTFPFSQGWPQRIIILHIFLSSTSVSFTPTSPISSFTTSKNLLFAPSSPLSR